MTGLPASGSGSIDDIQAGGFRGSVLFILQSNAANTSRVLRDITGGATAMKIENVGDFTNPANFRLNSIAPASITRAITVGQIHETYAFIGSVLPSAA